MSTSDGLARSAYYGFTYVPFATLNGSGNSANSITNSSINTQFNKTEHFSFIINSIKTKDFPKACSTSVTIKCLENYRGASDLVLMAAIIENDVDYQTTYGVPAKNGKNDYSHVLRKYISGTDGVSINAFTSGAEETFTFSYENDETYNNFQNLRIVVFIQDRSTKEILGAFQTNTHPFQKATSVSFNNVQLNSKISLNNNGVLNFNSPQSRKITIEIKKLNGQVISKSVVNVSKGQNAITLNTSSLSKGLYFLSLSGMLTQSLKFVIP